MNPSYDVQKETVGESSNGSQDVKYCICIVVVEDEVVEKRRLGYDEP